MIAHARPDMYSNRYKVIVRQNWHTKSRKVVGGTCRAWASTVAILRRVKVEGSESTLLVANLYNPNVPQTLC